MIFDSTVYSRPSRFLSEIPDSLKDQQRKTRAAQVFEWAGKEKPAAAPSIGISKSVFKAEVFKPGDMISHNVFGGGMVLSAKAMGGDTLLEVAFDNFGTKKLMANYAKIEKI